MFRKAREQMEKEMRDNPNAQHQAHAHFEQISDAQIQNSRYQIMENEINSKASALAREYVSHLPATTLADKEKMERISEQTYYVYKFINSPVEMLASGMSKMDQN